MIHQLKNKVQQLLEKFPTYRETDRKLIANIWLDKLKDEGYNIEKMTAMEFLKYYSKGLLPNEESIGRCRRKLQEENKHLRGQNYQERNSKQKQVIQEIQTKNWK